ncbi:hypothetical protein MUP29_08195 [bacterium]|nr:hypothetical protein [bacterium]
MFELLSNVQSVPIDQDSLAMVHRGMNKVRVSVGEHSSEPSEVYIITGRSSGNLESYVIFYMLEPGIHVVYGCDENPYSPDRKEQIIEEAIVFVEEMGSILEEVPWETMTPDQRSAWVEKEILYAAPVIAELERLDEPEELADEDEIEAVEYEEIDDEEPEEAIVQEDSDLEATEDVADISEDEVEQTLTDTGSDENPSVSEDDDKYFDDVVSEPEDVDEEGVDGVDSSGMEGVVIAEGDFDELLKQAFLKPDVANKTRLNKSKRETVKIEEEFFVPEEPADAQVDDGMVEEETELFGAVESTDLEEEKEIPEEPEAVVQKAVDWSSEELALGAVNAPAGPNDNFLSAKKIRIEVIRFLSRF